VRLEVNFMNRSKIVQKLTIRSQPIFGDFKYFMFINEGLFK